MRTRAAFAALAAALVLTACASLREPGYVTTDDRAPEGIHATAPGAMRDSPRVPVGSSPVRGRADALVTLVLFSDFECPYCARALPVVQALEQRYGDALRVVWKNFPLRSHRHAQLAAEAAMEAQAQQGDTGFWRFHDALFSHQRALEREDLERYAQAQQLDLARFTAALDAHTHASRVRGDAELASRLGVDGTPGFVVNGTVILGARPIEEFAELIDGVLVRARTIQDPTRVYAAMAAEPLPAPVRRRRPSPGPAPELDPEARYRVTIDGAPVLGPADALVTVVVFSDFECPYCARLVPTLAALRAQYGADVRIAFRHRPLPFHPHASLAAEAAVEAQSQRGDAGFWAMHDALFAHATEPEGLAQPALEQYAQSLGLDVARFRAALAAHTHAARVAGEVSLADALGVHGTPHAFINGRALSGAQPLARFAAAVDRARTEALAELARGTPRAGVYAALTAQGATAPVYLPAPPPAVYTVRENAAAPSRGAVNARVTVELFSDFQCPYCARVEPTLAALLARYPTELRVRWRDYPLPFHEHAMEAAEAAREALAQQGEPGFWRFHDALFAHRDALSRADLERYAQSQQLDMARFRAALDAHTHEAAVRADMAAGDATGAPMGTPAAFIQGELVSGARPFEDFARVIDHALGRN